MAITQNTYERRALHKVPRRPFPAGAYAHVPLARPVNLEPRTPAEVAPAPKFPGFWMWIGNSRIVWFVCDLIPAIGQAWREAGQHSKSLFSLDDYWLQ